MKVSWAWGALAPGGSDTVLLVFMPTLSLRALTSFLSILVGIYGVVKVMGLLERIGFLR